jgi:hypothetical protein
MAGLTAVGWGASAATAAFRYATISWEPNTEMTSGVDFHFEVRPATAAGHVQTLRADCSAVLGPTRRVQLLNGFSAHVYALLGVGR